MTIKYAINKPRLGVSYNGIDKDEIPEHGVRHYTTKKYWNVLTQKWTLNKPSPILKNSEIIVYNFKYFNLDRIKILFGKRWEKVAYFLTELFRKEITSGYKLEDWPWVYINYYQLRTYLGNDYVCTLEQLESIGLIDSQRQINKHEPIKVSVRYRLNINFILVGGEVYKETQLLSPDYQNTLLGLFSKSNFELNEVVGYIESVLDSSVIDISQDQRKDLIKHIVESKRAQDIGLLRNDFESVKNKNKLKRKLQNESFHYHAYEFKLKYLIESIESYMTGNQDFKKYAFNIRKDDFGNRISHIFSNVPKNLRKYIRIDGERVVEVDIISSQVSFLFVLIEKWFLKSNYAYENQLIAPWEFYLKYSTLSVINKNQDFYKILKIQVANNYKEHTNLTRDQMKLLFLKIALGEPKFITFSGYIKKEFITSLFGSQFYDFLVSLSKIEMKGVSKDESYKNIAAILQREESAFLDLVMKKLIESNIKFIPIYDSLVIKESDQDKVKAIFKEVIKSQGIEKFIRIDKEESDEGDINLTDYEHNLYDVVIDKDIINSFLKAS
jgi:hypothetical protein